MADELSSCGINTGINSWSIGEQIPKKVILRFLETITALVQSKNEPLTKKELEQKMVIASEYAVSSILSEINYQEEE